MNINILLLLLTLSGQTFQEEYVQKLTLSQYQKGVVTFFVDHGFLDSGFLHQWNRLSRKQESGRLSDHEMYRLMNLYSRINNAARRYQKEYDLIETGVVDGRIMDVIFGEGHSKGMFNGLF